jgi:copper homeostasis protein
MHANASKTLPNRRVLEVIACSLQDAIAAHDGGADRIEVCVRLDLQGLTPPVDMVESILALVPLPVRVMIRGGAGFTEAGEESAIQEMAALPLEGIVFGLLDAAGRLDFRAMDRVLRHAPPAWKWTLHRAFDFAAGSVEEKLAAVAKHARADRILTATEWKLSPPAGIEFIAGGGLDAANLRGYLASSCREFHFGRAARIPATTTGAVDAKRVRELADILRKVE